MKEYKCLIVEDSHMMRRLLSFAVSRIEGMTVVEADDGMEGLKKLSQDTFDVVVVDINMPIMDGLKLIKHIRNDSSYKEMPILVVTTEGADEDRERAMQLGVNTYISKPVQATAVLVEVQKLLGIDR
ncbi:MAG: response regulator [Proteobacteria bacterium]|nr:response regulator [Pseudomonadota bacterium]